VCTIFRTTGSIEEANIMEKQVLAQIVYMASVLDWFWRVTCSSLESRYIYIIHVCIYVSVIIYQVQ